MDPYRKRLLAIARAGLLAEPHETYVSHDGLVTLAPSTDRKKHRPRVHNPAIMGRDAGRVIA